MAKTSKIQIIIFFDTNFLESRNGKRMADLSKIRFKNEFYDVLKYIESHNLEEKIKLCIPEIVYEEIKEHYRKGYSSEIRSFNENVTNYRKIFGELLSFDYSLKLSDDINYELYINDRLKEAFHSTNCSIIPYYRDISHFEMIVSRAILCKKPFIETKFGSKEYSDAGFKDAIITETIINYCIEMNVNGLLLTNDHDFENVFDEYNGLSIDIVNSFEEFSEYISKQFKIINTNQVKKQLESLYNKESLFEKVGLKYDESVTDFTIKDIKETKKDSDIFVVKIFSTINETNYIFNIIFDYTANEILNVEYLIKND
jgi:hypothetical protein